MNTAQKIRGNPFWFLRVEHCNYPNSRQRRKTRIKIFLFLPFVKFDNKKKTKKLLAVFSFLFFQHTVCSLAVYNIHRKREHTQRAPWILVSRPRRYRMTVCNHGPSPPWWITTETNQPSQPPPHGAHTHTQQKLLRLFFSFWFLTQKRWWNFFFSLLCLCVLFSPAFWRMLNLFGEDERKYPKILPSDLTATLSPSPQSGGMFDDCYTTSCSIRFFFWFGFLGGFF